MNVSLTPVLEKVIQEKIDSGLYNNASEVVREALRIMIAVERRDRFLQSLDDAWEGHLRGESDPLTVDLLPGIKARSRENRRLGIPMDPDVNF